MGDIGDLPKEQLTEGSLQQAEINPELSLCPPPVGNPTDAKGSSKTKRKSSSPYGDPEALLKIEPK